jgi:hypothetical protein
MILAWRSRFVYGTGGDIVDWTTLLPTRAWRRSTISIGGSRTAAGGVPASHVVRRDYLLWLPLRLYESEVEDLASLITWGQSSESFLWYPDTEVATSYEVYLEHPVAGESLDEARMQEYPLVLEIEIALRRVVPAPWDIEFYTEE